MMTEFGHLVSDGGEAERTKWKLADLERKVKRTIVITFVLSILSLVAGPLYEVFVGGDIGFLVIGIGIAGVIISGILKWG